jgi:HSP20 family protein
MANPFDMLFGTTEAYRGDDKLVIRVDMPGVRPGSIDASVENGKLSIMAEREPFNPEGMERVVRGLMGVPGNYSFVFEVGNFVDPDAVTASYDAGVLTVTLPSSEKAKARKVQVNFGEQAEPSRAADASSDAAA